MNLIRLCLSRPVGVSVGVLLVILFGLLSLLAIPVQLTPNVDVPVVNVETRWPGANPQEVEREIVDRQEEMLRSVRGLRKMTSSSSDNMGRVTLEFYINVDRSEALRDVTDKLRQVSGYPLEVDEPTVALADVNVERPIAWLLVRALEDDGGDKVTQLRDFVEDNVKPYLDRIEGVASTDIYGGREREVQVRVDAGKLAARGLTFGQLRDALRRQNTNVSAGTRTQGKRDYAVRTVGQYASAEEILDTVVAYTPGGPVYVRDVAEVEHTFARQFSFVRSVGDFVLAIPVRREVGTNVLEVMAGVKEAIQQVNTQVFEAREMPYQLVQVYDETVYIHHAIAMVRNNIAYGGVLAVVVLMLFLRNWRATLIVALTIPISVIGTFLVVVMLGRTLNVVSLAGIAFAVGMVVDNAVVVLENIYRHRQLGKDIIAAAVEGTGEVWGAVLASTLTTMAVFIPVIFVQEEAGQLFRDISIAAAAAVGLSLIVSVTVIPTLAARLFRSQRLPVRRGKVDEHGTGRFAGFVAGAVAWVNRSWALRWVAILLLTCLSVGLIPLLVPPTTYLPSGNRNLIFGLLLTPPGYSIPEFKRMGQVVEQTLKPYWEVEPGSAAQDELNTQWRQQIEAMIAANDIPELATRPDEKPTLGERLARDRLTREWLTPPPAIDNFFYVAFGNNCFMGVTSRDEARVKPLMRLLQTAGQRIPGTYAVFFQVQLFAFGGGNTAEIQIRGDDLEKVTAAAGALFGATRAEFGAVQPSPPNFALGRPEVRIVPDRERAADLGLTAGDVGFIVEACVDGAYVGDFREQGGDTIDISLYVADQLDRPTQEIGQVPIHTPSGQIVPLASAMRLVDTTAQEQINHVERQRAVTLTVNPPETLALEQVLNKIQTEIEPELRASGAIDPGVLLSFTGNADKLASARATMVGEWQGFTLRTLENFASSRFFLSVLIVYLLMAALFESWVYPFVIMFAVPLAVCGGFLGLFVAHKVTLLSTNQPIQQLDVLTFLGFVILVGLVVNNAILLVHQTLNNLRAGKMSSYEAVREAVRVRVRPVFMTSLTTFFGQLPLALLPGAGSELYRGLAAVMLGGLLIATLGTLILVPAVLSVALETREWIGRLARGGAAAAATPRDR